MKKEKGSVLNEHTTEVQILLLKECIKERALIIYVIKSDLMDNKDALPRDYKMCMRDEIKNHKYAIADYEKDIKKLSQSKQP